MDKIYFLVKQVNQSLHDTQNLLDDEGLFGPMRGVVLFDCKQELDKFFGEKRKKW